MCLNYLGPILFPCSYCFLDSPSSSAITTGVVCGSSFRSPHAHSEARNRWWLWHVLFINMAGDIFISYLPWTLKIHSGKKILSVNHLILFTIVNVDTWDNSGRKLQGTSGKIWNYYLLKSSSSTNQKVKLLTAQSCPTLCEPMDSSTPGFPLLHSLLEFAQTRVHWVDDAIQPSHPLSPSSPPALNLFQLQSLFQWVGSSHQVAEGLELQLQHQSFQWIFRVGFLKIDWFDLLLSKRLSKGFSSTTVWKHQFFNDQTSLWQEYWSGLPSPAPGDLPNPGIEPRSPVLQMDLLPSESLGKPLDELYKI